MKLLVTRLSKKNNKVRLNMNMQFNDCKVKINEDKSCCNKENNKENKKEKPHTNSLSKDTETACNLIIESIALEQTAISYIIKSESFKIQKANELSENICDLIKLSEKSNALISSITALEQTLLMKLETSKKLIELKHNIEDKN